MYTRHRLDIGFSDLVRAAAAGVEGAGRQTPADALITLSVRSGFHLLLEALGLASGDEVVFSALTHPDLPLLVEHHGLVPVPVDLDLDTLAPRLDLLPAAISDRTRVVVVAHLFGGRVDLEPIAAITRPRCILLVEDCAQAFAGPGDEGDALAGVSMFSFGLLKTATAVGGALIHVRDRRLREVMSSLHDSWPVQTESEYRQRLLRCALLLAGGRPAAYTAVVAACAARGLDLDVVVNSRVRSFRASDTAELVRHLEVRPSPSLVATVHRRRWDFDSDRLARRAAAGEEATALLPEQLFHPGSRMLRRTHWLYPLMAAEPDSLVDAARAAGFDAARAASNLVALRAPAGAPELAPAAAKRMLAGLVYLPMYPEIPDRERRRLLGAIARPSARALSGTAA